MLPYESHPVPATVIKELSEIVLGYEGISAMCSDEVAQDLDRLLQNRKRVHLLPLQSSPWPTAKGDVLMAQAEPPDSP